MSGRFAGSKSLDERRRRRIVADEGKQTGLKIAETPPERPLPARRPTGRFPLRRLIPRSMLKVAAVGAAAVSVCGLTIAAGQSKAINQGTYGPGLAALCSVESGSLITALAGLMLLAVAQLAWLIRWARARSLQDFRGGYRVWWWFSAIAFSSGILLLTNAHHAIASTAVWLTGYQPFGTGVAYSLLPAFAAMLFFAPPLQREMRGCRTSRSLFLLAVTCWLGFGGAMIAVRPLTSMLQEAGIAVPVGAIASGGLLVSTAVAFLGVLFHARHVIYESVEPPAQPVRRKKTKAVAAVVETSADEEPKPKRSSSRRSAAAARTPTEAEPEATGAALAETPIAKPSTAKPQLSIVKPSAPVEAEDTVRETPQSSKLHSNIVAPARRSGGSSKYEAPDESQDESSEMADEDGRTLRLDSAEDLRGLSKRERRKLRKAGKERERSAA